MKKNKETNSGRKTSKAKKDLKEIENKLGINVPEDLKDFKKNKMQDNEVVKHLTDKKANAKKGVNKKVIHTNKPHVDRYNPSHTNTEHDDMTYVDNG